MAREHRYQSQLLWKGSTGQGYSAYERAHIVTVPPSNTELRLSSDAAFRGDPALLNPEQLLLAAASSCQLLSFLALAANAGVDVVAYEDDAEAVMPTSRPPMRITQVILRPRIVVEASADLDQVLVLVEKAHEGCFIANTLNADVVLEPVISKTG